ncbi:hypothetical protein Pcinc_014940 [Petrolisthes cinctipes]|uniref:Hyaluronidase n=1 Tax=Petrolisthes cinctipes TaxID=88211 RepID=A0AAE1KRA8_PETCI|nr:hypothetical protein Pcinc_014940 [Petrolisthes cinctipes]
MPSSIPAFTVYWNVPTQQCLKFGVHINVSAFGIVQNSNDLFYGDKVNIFYKPGLFPTLTADGRVAVNGGIPQNGSLISHTQAFTKRVQKLLPDNYSGIAVLDFEEYYPSLAMNRPEYLKASYSWVASAHPDWPHSRVVEEAERTFNHTAREFFEVLLWLGRELRPQALWGYYHYPYCHDYQPGNPHCKPQVMEHNNACVWLIRGSTALYPSIYITEHRGWSARARRLMTLGRLGEAIRMRHRALATYTPILPYFWYRYHDTSQFLSGVDVVNTLGLVRVLGLEGAVVWGGSKDMSTWTQCNQLKMYAEEKLGPLVKYLTDIPITSLPRLLRSRRRLQSIVTSALSQPSPP